MSGWLSAPRHLWRLLRILGAVARSGGGAALLAETRLSPRRRWLAERALAIFAPFGPKGDPALAPLPRALTALGPPAVKFGQMLSTRPDIVGAETALSLRMLQDQLPPFPMEAAKAILEAELGAPVEALFTRFDPPVAAASIAQAHPAITTDGRKVAVKILRPGVEALFRRDIEAFDFAARWLERLLPDLRRLKPRAVVGNFAETTRLELDLRLEAAASSEFAENTAKDPGFRLPKVDWARTARRVLTTEWIEGTPAADVAILRAKGFDMAGLAQTTIQSFLRHALRDGFFHADMHQGNLRIDDQGRLVALDFGIMGRLDPLTRRFYAEILLAFLNRDYRRAAHVHREAGYLPFDQDVEAFSQALRAIGEPIFGLGAANISMGRLLAQLFEVTEQFGMETQPQLILLQKTMIMVEGVAREFDRDVNMWRAARPVAEEWIKENLTPKAMLRAGRDTLRALSTIGPRLPELAERLAHQAARPPVPPKAERAWPAWLGPMVAGALIALAGGWML